jgi:hypothetical protein
MKVFYKCPFTHYHLQNQRFSGDLCLEDPVTPTSLSRYQRISGAFMINFQVLKAANVARKPEQFPLKPLKGEKYYRLPDFRLKRRVMIPGSDLRFQVQLNVKVSMAEDFILHLFHKK